MLGDYRVRGEKRRMYEVKIEERNNDKGLTTPVTRTGTRYM